MEQSQLGVVANVVAALALATVAASIVVPMLRNGQVRRRRLHVIVALVVPLGAVGHVSLLIRYLAAPDSRQGDRLLASWNLLAVVVAVAYLRLRRVSGPLEEGGARYEDIRCRQNELAGEVMAANVREELATERAAAADQRLARVFSSAPVGMAVVDRKGSITRANPALCRILGREQTDLVDARLADVLAPEDGLAVADLVFRAEDSGDGLEVRIVRPDDADAWGRLTVTPLADEDGSRLVQIVDATERHRAEERLEHLALHDPLTGLPNRVLFHTRATAALRQANRTGCYVACLFVDLDHFKVVNDSLGHAAGDRVLTMMADRLAQVVRPEDTVARMGGDEFCLLLVGLEHQAEADVVARRVCGALEGFVDLDGVLVTTSASVGVAVAVPGDRATSETLIRDADTALYRAKANGRSRTVLFDTDLRDGARMRLQMEDELRHALAAGELVVAYQPQWSLHTERVVGVEALVRWAHPTRGVLQPEQFLSIAIETGLVTEVGRQVLASSVKALARWQATSPGLRLAVNLAGRQVASAGLAEEVRTILAEADVDPRSLCLELSEADLTGLDAPALSTLAALHDLGVRIAIDDVGTGQSSLTHLVTLPVDEIKIDRSFVEAVHLPGPKRAIVEALLSLGRAIGLSVVAEGPETDQQLDALRLLGCDVVQGFITGRPLTEAEVAPTLTSRVPVGAR